MSIQLFIEQSHIHERSIRKFRDRCSLMNDLSILLSKWILLDPHDRIQLLYSIYISMEYETRICTQVHGSIPDTLCDEISAWNTLILESKPLILHDKIPIGGFTDITIISRDMVA